MLAPQTTDRISIRALAAALALAALESQAARSLPPDGVAEPGSAGRRREMIAELAADVPHTSIAEPAKLFDQFVGTWDTEFTFFAPDGKESRRSGFVTFGWVLDGRALQDIWLSYTESGERDLGTTVRFFDPGSGAWRVVWVYPANGTITILTGGAVGDRIVLRGQGRDGGLLRWSFNEIRNDTFVWRGEVSHNGGESWRPQGEYRMKRRPVRATESDTE